MRKYQRQIEDEEKVYALLDCCQTVRLGLSDEPYPYVVPLSFGWEKREDGAFIYFHCAAEGKKVDLIKKCPRVCVEADVLRGYRKTERGVTADYKSVIAFGVAERVNGAEAAHGLDLLLKHCKITGYSPETCVLAGQVAVYKITLNGITGKQRFPD